MEFIHCLYGLFHVLFCWFFPNKEACHSSYGSVECRWFFVSESRPMARAHYCIARCQNGISSRFIARDQTYEIPGSMLIVWTSFKKMWLLRCITNTTFCKNSYQESSSGPRCCHCSPHPRAQRGGGFTCHQYLKYCVYWQLEHPKMPMTTKTTNVRRCVVNDVPHNRWYFWNPKCKLTDLRSQSAASHWRESLRNRADEMQKSVISLRRRP